MGNATLNGTAGAITNGIDTISPLRIFPDPYKLGNISVITPFFPVEVLLTNPINQPLRQPTLANDWKERLDYAGLSSIDREPLLPCCTPKNE